MRIGLLTRAKAREIGGDHAKVGRGGELLHRREERLVAGEAVMQEDDGHARAPAGRAGRLDETDADRQRTARTVRGDIPRQHRTGL